LNDRSKQLRSDRRRGEILVGASGAFRKLGVRGAGMRDIAEAAGLSAGNLYYYFRNKQELIYFSQDRTLDLLLEAVRVAREKYGARAQIGWLIDGHLRALLGEQASGVAHLEFDDLPAPLLKKVVHKRDKYERAVRALIATGQQHGELRAGDPKLAAFALLGALNWAARWFRPGGGYDVETVAASFREQLLDGLVAGHLRSK
jgi:AcrR family transcriptional regulator